MAVYVVCWMPYHIRRLMYCYAPDERWTSGVRGGNPSSWGPGPGLDCLHSPGKPLLAGLSRTLALHSSLALPSLLSQKFPSSGGEPSII